MILSRNQLGLILEFLSFWLVAPQVLGTDLVTAVQRLLESVLAFMFSVTRFVLTIGMVLLMAVVPVVFGLHLLNLHPLWQQLVAEWQSGNMAVWFWFGALVLATGRDYWPPGEPTGSDRPVSLIIDLGRVGASAMMVYAGLRLEGWPPPIRTKSAIQ